MYFFKCAMWNKTLPLHYFLLEFLRYSEFRSAPLLGINIRKLEIDLCEYDLKLNLCLSLYYCSNEFIPSMSSLLQVAHHVFTILFGSEKLLLMYNQYL